ncbi:unnamed protein product [Diamesa serratosioi]
MFTKLLVIILITVNAEIHGQTFDCKTIDGNKFKELFKFDFGAGPKGIKIKLNDTKNFLVLIKDCKFKISETHYKDPSGKSVKVKDRTTLSNLKQCTAYEVSAKLFSFASQKTITYSQIMTTKYEKNNSKIDKISPDYESVTLSWSSKSNGCISKYHVNVKSYNKSIAHETTNKTSATIKNLQSCRTYVVELSVYDNDSKSIEEYSKSFDTKVVKPGKVTKVKVSVNETEAVITWDPPDTGFECIQGYILTYKAASCLDTNQTSCWIIVKNIKKQQTDYKLKNLLSAEKYLFQVYANEITSLPANASQLNYWEFKTINYEHFVVHNIREFRNSPTELQLIWSIDSLYTKLLKHYEITIANKVYETDKNNYNISIAACKTNYSINIRAVDKDGVKGQSTLYKTLLNDDDVVLSTTMNHQMKQLVNSVLISWDTLKSEEICILHYEIKSIEGTSIVYKPEFELKTVTSCVLSDIEITAVSLTNLPGNAIRFEFTPSEMKPKNPSIVNLIESSDSFLQIATHISPDDDSCSSTYVQFTCGNSTIQKYLRRSGTLKTKVSVKFDNLIPLTSYSCFAVVFNAAGKSDPSPVVDFITNESVPNTPINLEVQQDKNFVTLKWKMPKIITGYARNFQVNITHLKTLYDVPEECHLTDKHLTVIVNETQFSTITLSPYSEYEFNVYAENGVGKSDVSSSKIFHTLPSSASPPRNLSIEYGPLDIADLVSNISGKVSWSRPCFSNGNITGYKIKVFGTKVNHENHVFSKKIFDNKNSSTISDLFLDYNYKIELAAFSVGVQGEPSVIDVKTPSGIPLAKDLTNWTSYENSTTKDPLNMEVKINKEVFKSEAGEIIGIAFLLSQMDCQEIPQPEANLIPLNSKLLPSWNNIQYTNSNCIDQYQQTPMFSNPLIDDDDNDSQEFTFILGNGDCFVTEESDDDYCNGPLASNTKYVVIARLFTSSGFRDTEPIFMETRENCSNLITKGALLAGFLIILILVASTLILACCLCSRKKRKIKNKRKTSVRTDNDLLSFTSYCVVDRNTLPKK